MFKNFRQLKFYFIFTICRRIIRMHYQLFLIHLTFIYDAIPSYNNSSTTLCLKPHDTYNYCYNVPSRQFNSSLLLNGKCLTVIGAIFLHLTDVRDFKQSSITYYILYYCIVHIV